MLHSAMILFSSNILLAIANLLRVVIVARLLPLEDFGIAATFNILMNALTMAFGFSLGQLLIQAPDGDDPRLQASMQFSQVLLGVVLFLLFLLFATPYSHLMNIPEAAWAYRSLAFLALFVGFVHFDIYRDQRQNQFVNISLYNTLPMVVSLISIWPLFVFFEDWRLMPFALLVQGATALIISHFVGTRPYRLSFNKNHLRRGVKFGLPLFGNGILLFVLFSGDRVIVSNQFGLEELAWFSAAFMLTMMSVNILARNLQSILLPRLSKHAENSDRLQELAIVTCQAFALAGAFVAVSFALLGEGLLLLLFGSEYTAAAQILVLLAIAQGLRCTRAAPNILAMSINKTHVILQASFVRVAFIPLAIVLVALFNISLEALILVGVAAEITTIVFVLICLKRSINIPFSKLSQSCGLAIISVCLVLIISLNTPQTNLASYLPINLWAFIPLMVLGLSVLPMKSLRAEIAKRIQQAP